MPLCCLKQHRNPLGKIWCTQCDSLIAGAAIGDYVVASYLGQGHESSVYLAHQPKLNNHKVVIKLLPSVTTRESINDFRKEAAVLAALSHPYILPIYDYGIIEEVRGDYSYSPYLVLQYAEQGSLDDIFNREGSRPWSLQRVLPIIKEVAEALEYAHSQKILHGDVKPANIFMSGSHILLADFGVVDLIEPDPDVIDSSWKGSSEYKAPEAWHFKPGRYSDQYALAVTCYRLLTGEYPWKIATGGATRWIDMHHYVAPSPLRTYRPDLPVGVEEVLQRALMKEPHARYPSATAFAIALHESAQDERYDLENLVGQQLGNYRLVRLLSQSRFAKVYLGEHLTLKTQVAVKVPTSPSERSQRQRLGNEAHILADLQHPNIIRFVDFDERGEIPFLVIELAPNGTLGQLYPRGTLLSLTTIISHVKQIASALQYMHDKGYIHRYVRPTAMLVGYSHEILLGSFSIAISSQHTSETVEGAAAYMAPEQSEGKPCFASDQYALGVVVYQWLCGRRPFDGSPKEMREQHLSAPPPSMREQEPTIPLAVEQVVMKALAKNPRDRFTSVQEFAHALEQAISSNLVGQQLGSYRLVQLLGRGSWRDEYIGEHLTLKTQVAVKVLHAPAGEDMLAMFHNEAEILSSLHHPNIVQFIEFNDDPIPFLVRALTPNGTLRERYPAGTRLPLTTILSYVKQVAAALQYMHEKGYIHRNVKPENMALGPDNEVLLTGFSVAISPHGKSAKVAGTLPYMAPEQIQGEPLPASDQYALGIVVYEWLCGTPLFSDTSEEILKQYVAVRQPSLRDKDPAIPLAVEQVVLKALAKKTQERFPGVQEFADALEQAATASLREALQRPIQVEIRVEELEEAPGFEQEEVVFVDSLSTSSVIPDGESLEKIDSPSSLTSDVGPAEPILTSPTITYEIFLTTFPSSPLTVGRNLEVSLYLSPLSGNDSMTGYCFELSRNEAVGSELNILLNAPGFQFNGESVASLPIEVPPESETAPAPQVARFTLVALRPGTAKVSAEVYKGSDFLTNLEEEVQVLGLFGLEGIDEDYRLSTSSSPIRSRPVPQPDLILQVQTEWNADASTCKFWYVLNSFHRSASIRGGSYRSPSLSAGWVERSQRLLGSVLEECADGQPEDARTRLASLGYYLFQSVFPLVLQNELRNLARLERTLTLLILADQDAWLPWEVLHTGQAFLGEQFVIGRWMRELDEARPYEFPVGGVHVAHYANVPQPEMWVDLLTFPDIPEPLLLPVFADLEAAEAMRGLHLIRYGHPPGPVDLQDAPMMLDTAKSNGSVEAEFRPAKLSLRRNRPLVSLGYVSAGQPELTGLELAWAPTFVRAGCSAFVGPMWAVQPTVQAAFVSGFYSRLWAGDSLAGALQMGRRLAKAAAPDSLDWLAYVLFGDPMARPYRPVQGQGYALVEPIGREMDDPVPVGGSARFRVSLRRTPPVWHEERVIEVAETLNFADLQVYVVTFGLEVIPSPPIAMKKLTPDGDYLGWFTLSVPPDITAREVRVQVHFEDGMQPVHSLTFSLKLATRGGDTR